MSGKIGEVFKKENLILPNYDDLNIINLMQFIFNKFGADFKENKNINYLESIIPENKHTLLIIIDGMGSNLVSKLEKNSLLRKNKKTDLLTVSPSTTGCVLTSVATATFPIEHGIIGWYSHNKVFNIDYYPLLFSERKSEKSLTNYNIYPNDIFITKSMFDKLNVPTKVLYPNYICNSIYSNFVASAEKRIAYNNYSDISKIIEQITDTSDSTFTYLYLPEIDNLEHDNGVDSDIVKKELHRIEKMIGKLLLIKDLTIIITADHGQINIDNDIIMDFNKYNQYFYGMPGIDFATATFYVKKDKQKLFEEEFKNDYHGKMFLFRTEEFYENNIFGFEKPSENLKNNIGEYIGVCKNHYCFVNSENLDEFVGKTAGNHSGFSNDEMIIPLIVINCNDNA